MPVLHHELSPRASAPLPITHQVLSDSDVGGDDHAFWHTQLGSQNPRYPNVVDTELWHVARNLIKLSYDANAGRVKPAEAAAGVVRPFVFVCRDVPLFVRPVRDPIGLRCFQRSVRADNRKFRPVFSLKNLQVFINDVLEVAEIDHEVVVARRIKEVLRKLLESPLHAGQRFQRYVPAKQTHKRLKHGEGNPRRKCQSQSSTSVTDKSLTGARTTSCLSASGGSRGEGATGTQNICGARLVFVEVERDKNTPN